MESEIENKCETCDGDGIERCTNPDHGFLNALSFRGANESACPCCGHNDEYKILGCKCPDCDGTGITNNQKESK